jgi:hypothetical protein
MPTIKALLATCSIALFTLLTGCSFTTADDCMTLAASNCNECLEYEDDAASCATDHTTFEFGHHECNGSEELERDAAPHYASYIAAWIEEGCVSGSFGDDDDSAP